MRNLPRSTALRKANIMLLAAIAIAVIIVLESRLARILDDHLAATVIALIAAIIVVAFTTPVFADRKG